MGITNSKTTREKEFDTTSEEEKEGSLPSTPIFMPKTTKDLRELDPRSPSSTIVRTPIECLLSSEKQKLIDALSTPTANKLRTIVQDPRSPTNEYNRTPLVVTPEFEEQPKIKLRNKNLENVRKMIMNNSPAVGRDRFASAEGLKARSRLGNSFEKKRRSFAGFLETNLDFVETDLDSVPYKAPSVGDIAKLRNTSSERFKGSVEISSGCCGNKKCNHDTSNEYETKKSDVPYKSIGEYKKSNNDESKILNDESNNVFRELNAISCESNKEIKESDDDFKKFNVVPEERKNNSFKSSKIPISILEANCVDPRSPTTDFIRTPVQILKKIGEIYISKEVEDSESEYEATEKKEGIREDERNASGCNLKTIDNEIVLTRKIIEILETESEDAENEPGSSEEIEEFKEKKEWMKDKQTTQDKVMIKDKDQEEMKLQNFEEKLRSPNEKPIEDESEFLSYRIRTPSESNSTRKYCEKFNETPKDKNKKGKSSNAAVTDFDKKLTNLIYEDELCEMISPNALRLKEISRKPLSTRNRNENVNKSVGKLKVSDKPRKSEYAVSRIPVYRDKLKTKRVNCENTPPRSQSGRNDQNKSRWDGDNTLII